MASWHRFDLVDSSYAMGLMAHRTPAWTEPYVAILDQLIQRHTSWWSAADWLTQFGHDPDQANYPDAYRMFIPPELWGEYDTPGWTANGIEPYGRQMDPGAGRRHVVLQGVLPRSAGYPVDDRQQRSLESAVRDDPRRQRFV